jgi:hypothetical protein
MIKKLQHIIFFFGGAFIIFSCQKELNFQDIIIKTPGTSDGTAGYTFTQTNGTCSAPVIKGSYYKNTPLNSSNTVQVKVHVDSAGSYSIATANINGVLFGASGTFNTAGDHVITLMGAGTPSASGTFTFTPGAKGCSFTIPFSSSETNNDIAQFTLNGSPDSCIAAAVNGSYLVGVPLDSACTVAVKATVISKGTYTISTNAVNGILFMGSGTFLNDGQQTIILKGTGRPNDAGTFVFTPGTNGCQFAVKCTIQ